MARYVDPLVHNTMLDANLLDEVVSGTTPAVNRMVVLEGINIVLPYSVREELNRPATPAVVRAAANRFIYSIRVELTPPEIARLNCLINEARGNSQRKNVERDLLHILKRARTAAAISSLATIGYCEMQSASGA